MLNRGTILGIPPVEWEAKARRRALSPEEAYAKALDRDRSVRPQDEVGYRLYWLREDVVGYARVRPESEGHLVIGRHSQCDVVLGEQDAISLRHALVRATVLDDGLPMLSLLDLDTRVGFELSDGARQRAILATGPVVFRIGLYSFVALPSTGGLPAELPRPLVSESDSGDHRVVAKRIELEPRAPARVTRITVVPHSSPISVIPARATRDVSPTEAAAYRLVLEARGRRAAVELSARDVEHGVLLGRAEKCLDAGLGAVLDDGISRVHALVIREGDRVFLYDTASTNGTYAGLERVRRIALADEGTSAQLTRHAPVLLHWSGIHRSA